LEKDMKAEDIAEQLVKDWQQAGKMPPLAWDFRGFATEAAKRAAEIEREDCSNQVARMARRLFGAAKQLARECAINMRSNAEVSGCPPHKPNKE